ncbi:translationally-controlled tumor protein homolog [Convolutriloba macropyga]|uniref:translationally-controlled tumor protein homolog n=1 Tax=Convolutriloba macropyga TaxID=536237 RepID=UPI003F526C2A
MIIYKDCVTSSEMFCDASPVRKINDYVWEVIGGYAVRKDDVNDAMFGGNASAEGGDDETADGTIENKGIDVIMDQRLNEHAFQTKKEYQNYLKAYLKSVTKYLESEGRGDEAKKFKEEFPSAFGDYLKNFKEYTFFTGSDHWGGKEGDEEGLVVLQRWDDCEKSDRHPHGQAPIFVFIMAGLIPEKC